LKTPQQTEVNYFALLFDSPQYRDNNSLSKFITRFSELTKISLYGLAVVLRVFACFSTFLLSFLAGAYR
jgi:hypothetical protein